MNYKKVKSFLKSFLPTYIQLFEKTNVRIIFIVV